MIEIRELKVSRIPCSALFSCTAALAALSLAACVSYSPSQLSAMNTVDLCELEQMQRPNLSPETKSAMQGELQRRNESCSSHSAALAQRYADFMHRQTYGKHDNP